MNIVIVFIFIMLVIYYMLFYYIQSIIAQNQYSNISMSQSQKPQSFKINNNIHAYKPIMGKSPKKLQGSSSAQDQGYDDDKKLGQNEDQKDVKDNKHNKNENEIRNNFSQNARYTSYKQYGNFINASGFCKPSVVEKHLQNKSIFFMGQLQPLHRENRAIKEQLVQFGRVMASSTQMLKNLLPKPSSPEKRLQLELADLEQVAKLIKSDWHQMQKNLLKATEEISNLNIQLSSQQQCHQNSIVFYKAEIHSLNETHKLELQNLQQLYQTLQAKYTDLIKVSSQKLAQTHSFYKQRISQHQKTKQKLLKNQRQLLDKISQLERNLQKKSRELTDLSQIFQQNRLILIEQYSKNLQQRQQKIRSEYEQLLQFKKREHERNIQEINLVVQEISAKVIAKQTLLLQQYEITNKYIGEKQKMGQEIQKLVKQLQKCRQKIAGYLHEIQQKDIELSKSLQKTLQLEQKAKFLSDSISNLTVSLSEKSLELSLQSQSLSALSSQSADLNTKIENLNNSLAKSEQKIRQLERKVQEKQKQIMKFKEMKKMNIKMEIQVKELREKLDETQREKIEEKKKGQILNQFYLKLIQEMSKKAEIDRFQTQHKIRQQMSKHSQKLESQLNQKLKSLQQSQSALLSQYSQSLQSLKLSHKSELEKLNSILSSQSISHSQSVNQLKDQISLLQQKIQLIKEEYENKINEKQKEFKGRIQEMELLILKKQERYKRDIQILREQFQRIMGEEEEKWRKEIEDKERAMEEREREIKGENQKEREQRDRIYQQKIQKLQKSLKQLKNSIGIADIQSKYLALISNLQSKSSFQLQSLSQSHSAELAKLTLSHSQTLSSTIAHYESLLQSQQQKFSMDLGRISGELRKNISQLNQKLFNEKQQYQWEKMELNQKVQYLGEKIREMREILDGKNFKIKELQNLIEEKNMELSQVEKLVQRRMQTKKQQYAQLFKKLQQQSQQKLSKTTSSFLTQIASLKSERLAHTQSLYSQFKTLQQKFSSQYSTLLHRYNELEQIFQERPSRQEDVERIKELSIERQKMEMEVQECKKKIVSANQIVRYLNMELENYKDCFDIFGGEKRTEGRELKESDEDLDRFKRNMKYLGKLRSFKLSQNRVDTNKDKEIEKTVDQANFKRRQRKRRVMTQAQQMGQLANKYSLQHIQQKQSEQQDEAIYPLQPQRTYSKQNPKKLQPFKLQKTHSRLSVPHSERPSIHSTINPHSEPPEPFVPLSSIKPYRQSHHLEQEELTSNAQHFVSLMNKMKPAAQLRKPNRDYGRAILRRRTQSKIQRGRDQQDRQKQRQLNKGKQKYRIKDNIVIIQN